MKKWIEAATPDNLLSKMLSPLIFLSFGMLAVWYNPFFELILDFAEPRKLLQTVFALLILLISSLAYACFLIWRIVDISSKMKPKEKDSMQACNILQTPKQMPRKPDMRGVFRR